jgi:hypothetical protein
MLKYSKLAMALFGFIFFFSGWIAYGWRIPVLVHAMAYSMNGVSSDWWACI